MAELDVEALTKWAGKPLMRRAGTVLARGYEIESSPTGVLVRLPAQNITVRCLPGGLENMLCGCHALGPCEHKAAAVLAIKAERSGRPASVPELALDASAGAPRTRSEVRASVAALLNEIVTLGLSGLSQSAESRLRTLSTSAHGVDLPRLSRMLKSLADEVGMTLKRDASAVSSSLLISCARTAALCEALEHPTPALVGEHRSVYMPVAGSIEVIGLGARRWRTRSGYHGLSVFLWEPASRRWTGWNDARPLGTPGFDPAQRLDEGGPWAGCSSPRQAACTTWRLSGVHRNAVGRITARDNSRGIAGQKSRPQDGPLITDFSQLAPLAAKAFAPGLAERRDYADLVLLAPARWGPAEYDAVQQQVTRLIVDAAGRAVPLVLRHSPETDTALTMLQQIDGASVVAVLGSLRIGAMGLFVEPITLWTAEKPSHLTLDGAPAKPAAATPQPVTDAAEDDEDPEEEPAMIDASAVGHLLMRVESELVAIAEGGVSVIRELAPLREAARDLLTLGLASAAGTVGRLCDELERQRKRVDRDPATAACVLLQSVYVVHLAGECQTIALAAAALSGPS